MITLAGFTDLEKFAVDDVLVSVAQYNNGFLDNTSELADFLKPTGHAAVLVRAGQHIVGMVNVIEEAVALVINCLDPC